MGRTLTPERQKLKQDAIRLRLELGWSERQIARHLEVDYRTIHRWLPRNSKLGLPHNIPLPLNDIYCRDANEGMRHLAHATVDLVFTDPPYNIGVDYGNNGFSPDRRSAYMKWCQRWFQEIYRVLKPGGSFYVMHYPEQCALWLPELMVDFTLQRWIIWHYPTNVGQSPKNWTRSHRAILFVTKGKTPKTFNGLADPQLYRNPTDRRIQENLKERPGVVPYDVWQYNLVKNVSKEKQNSLPNQIPEALLRRILLTSSNEGDLVLDPFMGSGTTGIVAKQLNRKYIGFEINSEYVEIARTRVGNG